MKFKPLFDRVLIKPTKKEDVSNLGLVLPEMSKERPDIGVVVAIGDGEDFSYTNKTMKVKVGDRVLFNKFAGSEVELDEEKYLVMRQIDIVGVFDEREDNC